MEILTSLGLALPSGLNAYIPLLTVAVAQRLGWLELRPPFDLLSEWWAIALLAVLLGIEIVADKVPAVDSINDAVQSISRPAAGGLVAIAASGTTERAETWLLLAAGILLAGGVHAAKAVTRPVLNASTGGVGGPVVSALEDFGALLASILAIVLPLLGVLLVAGIVVALLALRRRRRRTATP